MGCFKAYDLRGKVPEELNPDLAYVVGRVYGVLFAPTGPVAVGHDIRLSSPALTRSLIRGLNDGGTDALDLGLCGTELVYFAAARPGMGGGIMVTASHNPKEYNGMKLVRSGAVPIGGDSGLRELERRVLRGDPGPKAAHTGGSRPEPMLSDYVAKLLTFVDRERLRPLRIVANGGNGCAGPILDALLPHLPFEVVTIQHAPDGTFPNGVPNPLLPENRNVTRDAVRREGADLGVAWDGDCDRCFFFDETGAFVDGYYIVGLLARDMLARYPGESIVHDPRMTWNTVELVQDAGGRPVQAKTGHAFMKERMRREDAVYGGEMSAHHYFRDFAYCDSGMIPWLLVASLMAPPGARLSGMLAERMERYPGSGEINSRVADADAAMAAVETRYRAEATRVETVDGLSMEFEGRWRFNLRKSQTEPILRLNVETRADRELLAARTRELLRIIHEHGLRSAEAL